MASYLNAPICLMTIQSNIWILLWVIINDSLSSSETIFSTTCFMQLSQLIVETFPEIRPIIITKLHRMILLLLLCFLPISQSANIFAAAILGGSHFTAIYDLVLILADAGHNITFVSMESGQLEKYPSHPNVHGIDIVVWDGEDKDMLWRKCVADLVKAKSADPVGVFSSGCAEVWSEVGRRSASVYTGRKVLDMFSRTQFDVLIGEKVELTGLILLGTLTNVPVVNFEMALFVQQALAYNNLPMLVASQPSMAVFKERLHQSPSFTERLTGLIKLFRVLSIMQTGHQAIQPFLEKFGFSNLGEVRGSLKLFLTNDHPAFTFPFLRSPNDIPIGCANLLGSKQSPLRFSENIQQFLEESAGLNVVYVSLGSYVKLGEVSWYSQLIDILIELNLRVIVKVSKDFKNRFPKSVLPLSWAPQKDLLRSGKVKLFISHCGNNGRVETIFYNVPVLCIPLFVDQPVNAELIKLNGFGESLMKEDISIQARDLISTMITNHESYREKMKKASDIVENEPGNVRERLIFYVEHVAKFKNADYLVNQVIKQQTLVETYNLDIILPASIISLTFLVAILFVICKLCIYSTRALPFLSRLKQKRQ